MRRQECPRHLLANNEKLGDVSLKGARQDHKSRWDALDTPPKKEPPGPGTATKDGRRAHGVYATKIAMVAENARRILQENSEGACGRAFGSLREAGQCRSLHHSRPISLEYGSRRSALFTIAALRGGSAQQHACPSILSLWRSLVRFTNATVSIDRLGRQDD